MPLTIDRVDFECTDIESNQWPKLGCSAPNQLGLQAASLRLEVDRELFFQDNGQIRSFDDNHKLVFNRSGGRLEFHAAGAIQFLTGVPAPVERVRIQADGNVGIGTATPGVMLHVAGEIRTDGSLQAIGDVTVGGALQVTGVTNLNNNAQIQGNLQVNGIVNAAALHLNGAPLRVSQWNDGAGGIHYLGGRVGIGTASPQGALEVNGDIRAGNSDLYFTKTDHNHTGVIGNQSGFAAIENAQNYDALMILGRAGTTKGRYVRLWDYLQVNGSMDITGRVGIDTTNPGAPLHVASYMAVGPFAATTGQGGIDVTGPAAEFSFVKRTLTAWPANPSPGDRFVWYNPDGTARLWTEDMGDLLTVTNDGNLGFGARVRQMINLWRTEYGIGIQGGTQYFRTDGNFAWYRGGVHNDNTVNPGGGAVQMVIRHNDNVGISTANPAVKLHVIGNRIRLTKASNANHFVDLRADGSALDLESVGADLYINNHGQTSTRIRNFVQISSQAFKENIATLAHQEALQVLDGLRSVKFSYKDDETSQPRLGFIAEEVPAIVATADQTGFRPTDVLAALTTVVQEQARQITCLLDKVAALEAAGCSSY